MKVSRQSRAWSMLFASVSLAACSGDFDGAYDLADEPVAESELGALEQALTETCPVPEATASVQSALVVAAAAELGRWQATKDFSIVKQGVNEVLALSALGKARCADRICAKTQALLDLQKDESKGQVKLTGGATVDPAALRVALVAKYRQQLACDAAPSNAGTTSCPIEEHTVRVQQAAQGVCGMDYEIAATQTNGQALKYAPLLKNKLIWADRTNPYLELDKVERIATWAPISVLEPLGGAPPDPPASGGCTVACTKVSYTSVAGQCCICNGATKTFTKASFSNSLYLCI
jgi:hypothetical protein